MDNPEKADKKPMTEEERIELAAKLDKELDEFIDSLPKKRYEDGWPEDRWEEEMEKHPFFMKKHPEPGAELHPLYEGLQKLKYDPEENQPDELAIAYKDDGNFNFKHKNYRLAIVAYTEGIRIKCGVPDIEATLLNNRAASHYFLKNYRSCLRDCELALKAKPGYEKVLLRAANCCYEMKNYAKGIEFCDSILNKDKENSDILNVRKKCVNAAKLKERDERRREVASKKKAKEESSLMQEIRNRGYQIEGGTTSLEILEPCFPQLVQHRVHFDENNCLVWPVVWLYPEYQIMDYIQEFNETNTLSEFISQLFESRAAWDEEGKYQPNTIKVYHETSKKKLITIDVNMQLADILKLKEFIIKGGTPAFILLVHNSPAEIKFLENY